MTRARLGVSIASVISDLRAWQLPQCTQQYRMQSLICLCFPRLALLPVESQRARCVAWGQGGNSLFSYQDDLHRP